MTTDRRGSVSLTTATSLTVANMIGTGVFTSLGFQVVSIRSGFALLALWVLGGVFALCGALSYGELAAAFRRSGGEFNFLSRLYHPSLGFLAGWTSVIAGFTAPVALAAMAFGGYLARVFPAISPVAASCGVVIAVTLFHLRDLRLGSGFQNLFTLFKVALIVVFVGAALTYEGRTEVSFAPKAQDLSVIFSSPFAVSLLFVMYAYTGWNASTYILSEIKDPARNVPKSLWIGTVLVLVLYVALHWVFLTTTPMDAMAGQLEVGHIVATQIFGTEGGRLMSSLLCIALISAISAMTWAGPRVTQAMGEEYSQFRALGKSNASGIPARAILLQSALVTVMLLTSSFEYVLVCIQLVLTAWSLLTVVGVFILRRRYPDLKLAYRTWGYPITPLLFAAISLLTFFYTLMDRPWESLIGLLVVLAGLPLYFASKRRPSANALPTTHGE